jgi:adenylate cyclase class 2
VALTTPGRATLVVKEGEIQIFLCWIQLTKVLKKTAQFAARGKSIRLGYMTHLNVEIKARCGNQDKIRNILKKLNADFKGTDHQLDTYFNVPVGRLKLREGSIENYLIYYQRKNQDDPKESQVTLFQNNPRSSLKSILQKALGILVSVDKTREIYFLDNVKFHLDSVVELGSFIEIEAIDFDGSIDRDVLYKQCEAYMSLLEISSDDLISHSYSDLLKSIVKFDSRAGRRSSMITD